MTSEDKGVENRSRRESSKNPPEGTLRDRLEADLLTAMKSGKKTTVTIIREMLTAIDNAGAVELNGPADPVVGRSGEVPGKVLSEKQIREVLRVMSDEHRSAINEYKRLGIDDDANRLRKELNIITHYLEGSNID